MFGMVSERTLFAVEQQQKFDQFFKEKQDSQAAAGIGPDADQTAKDYETAWRAVFSHIDDRAAQSATFIEKVMTWPLNQVLKYQEESDRLTKESGPGTRYREAYGGQFLYWAERLYKLNASPLPGLFSEAHGDELPSGAKGITVDGSAVSSSNPLPVSVKDVNGATVDGGSGGSWWDRITSFFGGGSASSGGRGSGGIGPGGLGPGSGGRGGGAEAGGATASAGTFMDALAQIESTNRNIHSSVDPDPPGFPGGNSQGYFQINTPTWRDFAPRAGVDLSQYPNAMSAPRDIQALVAAQIPLSRFGGRTRAMLRGRFGGLSDSDTIGQLAAAHGGAAQPAPSAGQTNGRYPGRTIPSRSSIPAWANPYDSVFDSGSMDPSQKAHAKGVNWDFSDPNAAALGRASIDTSKTLSSNITNNINVTSTDPHEAAAMVALHLDRTANDVTRNLQGAAQAISIGLLIMGGLACSMSMSIGGQILIPAFM
jgi:hypothetical protein